MNLLSITPLWAKRLARKVLPEKTVESAHNAASGDDYVPWMVSRENPLALKFKRDVLRQDPRLHRLVVHLTDHCNLNCRGCTHFSNIAKPAFADPDQFAADFERLSHIFSGINEIYLLGGEPLLHPRVAEFLGTARRSFPHSRINLMSNGLLVTKMDEKFWRAMAENDITLVCDLYPVGLKVDEIDAITKKFGVHLEWTDPRGEFFKLPIDLTGSQDPKNSFEGCGGVNNCPILRDGRLYPCAYAAYSDILQDRFGIEGLEPGEEDSIAIDGTHTPYEIFDFLCKPVPWCRFCDVDQVSTYEWARSERKLDEWTVCGPKGPSES
jgi:MoaA/NifB/PqqE/SkfB family radical SAM enzyme